MPVSRVRLVEDERGTTLVEALVALAAGGVVLAAISTVLIVSLHGSDRISARVDANQRARIALNKIIDQLHSACIAPQIAPVQKESSGTQLSFIHQTGSAVALTPVLSKISLVGGTLTQSDYPAVSGSAPTWTYATNPSSTTQLMTKISPTAPSTSIFSYYKYENGKVAPTPLETPLNSERAASTVKVAVAFTAAPLSAPVNDPNVAASIQSSANLRLTPPSFTTGANAPCQ
jgi:hypothetical protein